jgi:hypothetical protein
MDHLDIARTIIERYRYLTKYIVVLRLERRDTRRTDQDHSSCGGDRATPKDGGLLGCDVSRGNHWISWIVLMLPPTTYDAGPEIRCDKMMQYDRCGSDTSKLARHDGVGVHKFLCDHHPDVVLDLPAAEEEEEAPGGGSPTTRSGAKGRQQQQRLIL